VRREEGEKGRWREGVKERKKERRREGENGKKERRGEGEKGGG
jgi:hypothetical protein